MKKQESKTNAFKAGLKKFLKEKMKRKFFNFIENVAEYDY